MEKVIIPKFTLFIDYGFEQYAIAGKKGPEALSIHT